MKFSTSPMSSTLKWKTIYEIIQYQKDITVFKSSYDYIIECTCMKNLFPIQESQRQLRSNSNAQMDIPFPHSGMFRRRVGHSGSMHSSSPVCLLTT